MRKVVSLVAVFSLLALTGCLFTDGGLQAVIRTDPSSRWGPYTVEWTFDGRASRGEIEQYLWAFADEDDHVIGTDEGPVVKHRFDRPGVYTVYLTVVASGGSTHQTSVTVNVRSQYPIAEFEVVRTGKGSEILFDASASYDPDGKIEWYIWDFGDGSRWITTDPEVKHTYPGDGSYMVTLVVEDDNGDRSAPVQREVVISGSCSGCG